MCVRSRTSARHFVFSFLSLSLRLMHELHFTLCMIPVISTYTIARSWSFEDYIIESVRWRIERSRWSLAHVRMLPLHGACKISLMELAAIWRGRDTISISVCLRFFLYIVSYHRRSFGNEVRSIVIFSFAFKLTRRALLHPRTRQATCSDRATKIQFMNSRFRRSPRVPGDRRYWA